MVDRDLPNVKNGYSYMRHGSFGLSEIAPRRLLRCRRRMYRRNACKQQHVFVLEKGCNIALNRLSRGLHPRVVISHFKSIGGGCAPRFEIFSASLFYSAARCTIIVHECSTQTDTISVNSVPIAVKPICRQRPTVRGMTCVILDSKKWLQRVCLDKGKTILE